MEERLRQRIDSEAQKHFAANRVTNVFILILSVFLGVLISSIILAVLEIPVTGKTRGFAVVTIYAIYRALRRPTEEVSSFSSEAAQEDKKDDAAASSSAALDALARWWIARLSMRLWLRHFYPTHPTWNNELRSHVWIPPRVRIGLPLRLGLISASIVVGILLTRISIDFSSPHAGIAGLVGVASYLCAAILVFSLRIWPTSLWRQNIYEQAIAFLGARLSEQNPSQINTEVERMLCWFWYAQHRQDRLNAFLEKWCSSNRDFVIRQQYRWAKKDRTIRPRHLLSGLRNPRLFLEQIRSRPMGEPTSVDLKIPENAEAIQRTYQAVLDDGSVPPKVKRLARRSLRRLGKIQKRIALLRDQPGTSEL